MIDANLLRQRGTIEALTTLAEADGAMLVEEFTGPMNLAETTARQRLNEISDAGLIKQEATIRDNQAVLAYVISDDGEEVANKLAEIVEITDQEDEE